MKKPFMVMDVALCQGCNNCFLACKDEFFENNFPPHSLAQPRHGHRWMNILCKERGKYPKVDVSYLTAHGMQCDNAPCIAKASDGAVYKRDDGIVIIDPEKARGQKDIVNSCPYEAIFWNEEKQVPQKCTFCAHLLEDGWKEPRCVQACPTGALTMVRATDPEREHMVVTEALAVYCPEFKTAPRVHYKNLGRFTHHFIAGSLAFKDTDECATDAEIRLTDDSGQAVMETRTDNYGDFIFDGLKKDSGPYRLEIRVPDYQDMALTTKITESLNLGTLFLDRQEGKTA